ncbi:MAG: efflux RND transporter permease subunit [Saprospiraceae bacterium]|nr:efflux RND transporter permease subunit [Saprospiraceae bacterium]
MIRLRSEERQDIGSLRELQVDLANGQYVPMSELAHIDFAEGPTQISREDTKRRITIGVNARNIDIATLVSTIEEALGDRLELPTGYYIRYGGQFENLQRAQKTLAVVVPIALGIILLLLYLTFNSLSYALLIFVAIPLSAIGGIWALYFRSMPFSISAGVGFIALFGVAVLNGIVLIGYFNQLRKEGMHDIKEIIAVGTKVRLRPVVMTAAVASLGFLPMALSKSAGAEVQQPLATVVIGGLITATFLTMVIMPILYYLLETRKMKFKKVLSIAVLFFFMQQTRAQEVLNYQDFLNDLEGVETHLQKSAELQKEGLLEKSKKPLAPNLTSLSLSTEEYQFTENSGIQSFNLRQDFRLSKPASAYRSLYQSQTLSIDNQMQLMQRKQRLNVMATFIETAYLNALLQIEYELQHSVQEYLRISTRRAELGDGSGLVVRQIQQIANNSQIEIDRLTSQKEAFKQSLLHWSGRANLEVVDLNSLSLELPLSKIEDQPVFSH